MHQEYNYMLPIWRKMYDTFMNERHIKTVAYNQQKSNFNHSECSQLKELTNFDDYIRPTDFMRSRGQKGKQRFADYIYRAKWYPFPSETMSQSIGLIENEPAVFDLPTQFEFMLKDATANHESLSKVLSIVNQNQLQYSRLGLLLEPSMDVTKPYNIAIYNAMSIVDWHEIIDEYGDLTLDWVVLKTDEVDDNDRAIYLILTLDVSGVYYQYKTTNEDLKYEDAIEDDSGYVADSMIVPVVAESTFNRIPFVIINATMLGTEIQPPYLESISDASLSLFRADAHQKDALHWGGESTLFCKGYGKSNGKNVPISIGNGAANRTDLDYADAKFVSIGTDGIAPRKEERDKALEYCVSVGVDLINQGVESGEALRIRIQSKTPSLKTLSITGALGLQRLLRIGAEWLGIDPEAVIITANTTFAETRYTVEEFVKMSSMVSLGTMAMSDFFAMQKKQGLTQYDTEEEWSEQLEREEMQGESLSD